MRERDLIDHIRSFNHTLPAHVTIPPGDDMGAIQLGGQTVLITVDQVADGVHVNLANTPLALVARKAITRNLSDVAAMAAMPVGAVVAAALPRDFGQGRADQLFDHMRAVADRYGCPLVGGDVTVWDHPLLLSVTVFADPAGVAPVLRSGAKVGDAIYVTGELGGAWSADGGGPHLTFEPRLRVARLLADSLGDRLHSMIDLSDGLATDLAHICRMSSVSALIEPGRIPLRDEAGGDATRALTDGEDYELCFTADPSAIVPPTIDGVRVTRIGTAEHATPEAAIWRTDGVARHPLGASGWEHRG